MRILTIDISSSFPIFPGTEHKYPYDWRTKKPTIFRATEQWFASVEGFRHTAMDAIGHVKWVPPQVYYFSTFRCYIIPLICKMFFFSYRCASYHILVLSFADLHELLRQQTESHQ